MLKKSADEELIAEVQRGNKKAFDLLVIKYQSSILNLLGRYLQDSHEIYDVAQEVFIKAYRALARFRGDSAFYTWLYRIAINTAKTHLMNRNRYGQMSLDDTEQPEVIHPALRQVENPENQLMTDQLEQVIFTTIQQLPEELKMAITLRELEGLSYEEIAEVMECPIGTVRSRIFRARETIDETIKPLLSDQ